MQATDRDLALLTDMHAACREVGEFMQGVKFNAFVADRKLCLAVERCLEIVGEAAGKVSASFQAEHPEIKWRQIKGLRNVLAHEYGNIEYRMLYETTKKEVPVLLRALMQVLPKDEGVA